MADTEFEGTPQGMAQEGRARKLWSRVKRFTNNAIALARPDSRKDLLGKLGEKLIAIAAGTPDSRKANEAPTKGHGGEKTQGADVKDETNLEKRKPDLNKELPTEKPLPAVPYDKDRLESLLKPTAEKFMANQAAAIAKANMEFGKWAQLPPPVAAEDLLKGAGETSKLSRGAERHPQALAPERSDRSNALAGRPAVTGEAQRVTLYTAGKARIIQLGNRPAANAQSSTDFTQIQRSPTIASISSIGSARSFGSTSSDVSRSSTGTADTSMSIHDAVIPQKAQPTNEGRKPASELYEASRHTPQHGR